MTPKRFSILILTALMLTGCDNATVIYPSRKEIIETVYASGIIVPHQQHWLSSQAHGKIIKKLVDEGDTVTKGQLLYIISNEVAQQLYEATEANYQMINLNLSSRSPILNELTLALNTATIKFEHDSINYARWKNLWEQGIGTKSNLDKMYITYRASQNEMRAAKEKYTSTVNELTNSKKNTASKLTVAREDLSNVYVRSDCNGVAFKTTKEEGESVTNGERMVLLGNSRESLVELMVDQQDIARIKPGQTALLTLDALEDSIFEATISFIAPSMTAAEQSFKVEATCKNLPVSRFMHSAVEANIVVNTKKNALVLPRTALAGPESCWIKEKGKAKMITVKTGLSTLDEIEILAGLTEKTAVLIKTENAP